MTVAIHHNRLLQIYATIILIFVTLSFCGYALYDQTGSISRRMHTPSHIFSDMTYYDLPRISVGVARGGEKLSVRIELSLEVQQKDAPLIAGYEPRIADAINAFFLKLRPDQLKDFGTSTDLRRELVRSINSAGAPAMVEGVLLREVVIM